jgi:hypothetical protein
MFLRASAVVLIIIARLAAAATPVAAAGGIVRLKGGAAAMSWDDVSLARSAANTVNLNGKLEIATVGDVAAALTALQTSEASTAAAVAALDTSRTTRLSALDAKLAAATAAVDGLETRMGRLETAVCVPSWGVACPAPAGSGLVEYRTDETDDSNFPPHFSWQSGFAAQGNTMVACNFNQRISGAGPAPFGPGSCLITTTSNNGRTWQHQQTLQESALTGGTCTYVAPGACGFGEDAKLDGDRLLVSQSYWINPAIPSSTGRALLYKRTGTTWTLQQELLSPSEYGDVSCFCRRCC